MSAISRTAQSSNSYGFQRSHLAYPVTRDLIATDGISREGLGATQPKSSGPYSRNGTWWREVRFIARSTL